MITEVKKARTNRRCEGCSGFVTIHKGDRYFSYSGFDSDGPYRFALCERCHTHVSECKECEEWWYESEFANHIGEHWRDLLQTKEKETNTT